MKVYGLTGGIGMGKSTAGEWLCHHGVAVVDSDAIARQVVEPGQQALEEIKAEFGEEFIHPDGSLRRGELAKRVFPDAALRQRLEAILHPRIRVVWQTYVAHWRAEGRPVSVVVIPLLFETSAMPFFDVIVCVACSASVQRQRLLGRGWSVEEIDQRNAAQWSIEKKMSLSNHVLWTDGDLDTQVAQLRRIFREIKG